MTIAAHYRQPQSFGDMVLTDRGLTTEIAQFQLGDLNYLIAYPSLYMLLGNYQDVADRQPDDREETAMVEILQMQISP